MRTVLYANQGLASYLRENFILHWSSERPVPRITIDFGDGRTIERTITGNSAHYVLDANGEVLDVLTGLYHPMAFHDWLEEVQELARAVVGGNPEYTRETAADWHRARLVDGLDGLVKRFADNPETLRQWVPILATQATNYSATFPIGASLGRTSAAMIWRDMPTGEGVPAPTLIRSNQINGGSISDLRLGVWQPQWANPSFRGWESGAYRSTALSTSKRVSGQAAMLRGRPSEGAGVEAVYWPMRDRAPSASIISPTKSGIELRSFQMMDLGQMTTGTVVNYPVDTQVRTPVNTFGIEMTPFQIRLANVANNLAGDVAVGELVLRPVIHLWLAERSAPSFEELNRRVFADLFLTPANDPWLGLSGDGNWTGVRNDGFRFAE
jgi:hypothetical protein